MGSTNDDPRGGTRGKLVTLLPGYEKVREGESDKSRTTKETLRRSDRGYEIGSKISKSVRRNIEEFEECSKKR